WRAVAATPSAPTARQLAYRFKPSHIRAIERAAARCGNELDRKLGRDPSEQVTFDLDATESVVYGRRKQGTGRSRQGHLAYNSYVVTWAERGRALTSDLKGGNQARIKASQSLTMLARAKRLLGTEHGQITVRGDSGFYAIELMNGCRKRSMRFTISATRTSVMWAKLAEIPDTVWEDATQMARKARHQPLAHPQTHRQPRTGQRRRRHRRRPLRTRAPDRDRDRAERRDQNRTQPRRTPRQLTS